jgi:tRNA threonylcarbamoyladenosine biosynthesis protein TsaE
MEGKYNKKEMLKIFSGSESRTVKIGQLLGSCLENGYVVCLEGDLGSGKTVFVKGIAKGIGVKNVVTSPTFVLVNEYHGEKNLYHFDVYRIQDAGEFLESGLDEYFDGSGVIVVEWADRVREALPDEKIRVIMEKGQEKDSREISLLFQGNSYLGAEREFRKKMEALK